MLVYLGCGANCEFELVAATTSSRILTAVLRCTCPPVGGTEVSFVVVAATVPKEDDENRKAYARGLAQRINEFPGGDTGV